MCLASNKGKVFQVCKDALNSTSWKYGKRNGTPITVQVEQLLGVLGTL
jgi:hypothetical protein